MFFLKIIFPVGFFGGVGNGFMASINMMLYDNSDIIVTRNIFSNNLLYSRNYLKSTAYINS